MDFGPRAKPALEEDDPMDDLTRRAMLRHSGAMLALLPAAAAGAVDVQGQQPPPPPPGAPSLTSLAATADAARLLDAWDAWCDAMKGAAREIILREQAPLDDPPTLADGFRYLARLAALGIGCAIISPKASGCGCGPMCPWRSA